MRRSPGTRARMTFASLVVLLGTALVPLATPSVAATPLTATSMRS